MLKKLFFFVILSFVVSSVSAVAHMGQDVSDNIGRGILVPGNDTATTDVDGSGNTRPNPKTRPE